MLSHVFQLTQHTHISQRQNTLVFHVSWAPGVLRNLWEKPFNCYSRHNISINNKKHWTKSSVTEHEIRLAKTNAKSYQTHVHVTNLNYWFKRIHLADAFIQSDLQMLLLLFFYLSHTQLYREYITSSEMYSLHLTHPKWTRTRSSGQPCYSARGAVGGSVPCSRTPQSWYWRRILSPPTIPAGPEIRTHNLPLTSPTRYPLGHDCPHDVPPRCAIQWVIRLNESCMRLCFG